MFFEWQLIKLAKYSDGQTRLVIIRPRRAERGLNFRVALLGYLDLDVCYLPRLRLVK